MEKRYGSGDGCKASRFWIGWKEPSSHVPEWQTKEGIRAWVRQERDSWDREWDSEPTAFEERVGGLQAY